MGIELGMELELDLDIKLGIVIERERALEMRIVVEITVAKNEKCKNCVNARWVRKHTTSKLIDQECPGCSGIKALPILCHTDRF